MSNTTYMRMGKESWFIYACIHAHMHNIYTYATPHVLVNCKCSAQTHIDEY